MPAGPNTAIPVQVMHVDETETWVCDFSGKLQTDETLASVDDYEVVQGEEAATVSEPEILEEDFTDRHSGRTVLAGEGVSFQVSEIAAAGPIDVKIRCVTTSGDKPVMICPIQASNG